MLDARSYQHNNDFERGNAINDHGSQREKASYKRLSMATDN